MRVPTETMQSRLSRKQAGDQYAGMPRSIRSRLLNPRAKKNPIAKAAVAAASPAMENQGIALNASGRMALGPWLGPYCPVVPVAEAEPGSPTTLYVHYKGRVYSDLDGATAAALPEEEAGPHHGSVVAAALPVTPRQRKDQRRELALMNNKGTGKRHNMPVPSSPKLSTGLRRTRMLNQPRSGF